MSGLRSRNKGKRGEREVVNAFRAAGYNADRLAPVQAGLSTEYPDVKVFLKSCFDLSKEPWKLDFLIESKLMEITPNFHKIFNEYLALDAVVHRKNHQDQYITMRMDRFIRLLKWAGVTTFGKESNGEE